MKAYYLSIKDDYEGNMDLVFANTAKEAKKLVWGTYLADSLENYIDLRVNRAKNYDGMEGLSPAQLAFQQWQDGWRWFDMDYPDPDTASEDEFMQWYEDNFGAEWGVNCGDKGGRAIGSGHECICGQSKNHDGNHGCECGAIW